MDQAEKLDKLKELRSQEEVKKNSISIKFCLEALEKKNYDVKSALQWLLQEKASLFRKVQGDKEGQKPKFGIVSIKERERKIVAFVLTYTDPSLPSDNEQLQETVAKIADIFLENFSLLQGKDKWELPSLNQELDKLSLAIKDREVSLEKSRFFQQKEPERLGIYLHHNKKIGALVLIEGGDEEIAHELALQIVANKPQFLSLDSIPQVIKEKEKQKFLAQIQEKVPGKNPEAIKKIVQQNLDKYLIKTYACFLEQSNFRDPETKIKDYLAENQVKIKEFCLLTTS
jgi:translation elongation factor EF-Ts